MINPPLKGYRPFYPPLGLLYIAAVLRKEGFRVDVVTDLEEESLFKEVIKRRPNIVGITMSTAQVRSAYSAAAVVKEATHNKTTVVVGGPHPSALPRQVLLECPDVDIAVIGEGEVAMTKLVRRIEDNGRIDNVKGICYRKNGKITMTELRSRISRLDSLPFPAYDLIHVEKYFRNQVQAYTPSLAVMATRGCPFGCTFCSNPVWRRVVRYRSAENIANEIEWLHERFKVKEVYFPDDTFNLRPEKVKELCDELIQRGLNKKIVWRTQCRVNKHFTPHGLFLKMRKAGCWMLDFGVESGNQEILKKINKGITLDEVRRAFKLARNAGLKLGAFFMIGNLGESEETIKDTLQFAKELNPDTCWFSIATPYPGSQMYEELLKRGVIRASDWSKCDNAYPVFGTDTFSAEELIKYYNWIRRKYYLRFNYVLYRAMRIRSSFELLMLLKSGWGQFATSKIGCPYKIFSPE